MKPIPSLLCVLLVLTLLPAVQAQPLPRRENIILIVADGLAANDLSCYGQTQFQTPHLDQLAAGGIRFDNYLAGGVTNAPALASLVTGKNTTYLPGMDFSLTANDVTIAQLLKDSGYSTCLLGEWTLGDQNSDGAPWRHGFDQFGGYFDAADAQNPYPDFVWRYFPHFNPASNKTDFFNNRESIYNNTGGRKNDYISDLLTKWSMTFAKKKQPDWFNHYQPFFLMLDYPLPGNGRCAVPTDAPFSEEAWPQPEKNRAAAIARLDGYIGQLVEQLNKFGQVSNTVIFFTSDTAPQKGGGIDPKFFQENSAPDDLHVPLIVSWPGKIPAGQVSSHPCSARDVLPTIAALADISPTEDIDGKPFASVLFGQKEK